jgi:hypothetical protein
MRICTSIIRALSFVDACAASACGRPGHGHNIEPGTGAFEARTAPVQYHTGRALLLLLSLILDCLGP